MHARKEEIRFITESHFWAKQEKDENDEDPCEKITKI